MASVGCQCSHYLLSTLLGQRNHCGTGSSNDLGRHWTWGKGLDCPLREDIAHRSCSLSLLKDLEGSKRHGIRRLFQQETL